MFTTIFQLAALLVAGATLHSRVGLPSTIMDRARELFAQAKVMGLDTTESGPDSVPELYVQISQACAAGNIQEGWRLLAAMQAKVHV